jgi:hypothetical protein
MRITESKLRRLIRSVLLESVEEKDRKKTVNAFGEYLSLNYGDKVELLSGRINMMWLKDHNSSDIDFAALPGSKFKVVKVYYNEGDESDSPMILCDLLDYEGIIKMVPCYSKTLKVVKRENQLSDLNKGDIVKLNEIPEDAFSRMSGKVKGNLQDLLGSYVKILDIEMSKDFNGKPVNQTRYALVSPVEEDNSHDENIVFAVPLVKEFIGDKIN